MKLKRNPITIAIKRALVAGIISSLAITQVTLAQNETDDEVVEIEKQEVTGSRIKRSNLEGALPVTVITREQIELSGESNAADYLRALTFNSGGSFRPQSGSSAQGVSTISLRGIGASRTLVLVDGRRLPKSPSTGSSQDLNTIPLGAIERIEILTDGASAIYGSDAIGGVVNVITRTDFQGAEIMLGGAEVSIPEHGGERSEGHALFGASSDTSNIIAGVSWNDREIIFARDLPWNVPGGSTFSNNFRRVSESGGETGPFIPVLNGCSFPGTGFYILESTGRCAYDFNLEAADEASTENKSLFVKVRHDINDNWQIKATGGYYQTSSFGRYAPVPDGSRFGTGVPLSINSPNNPSNPNSPNYDPVNFPTPEEVHWRHRFDAVGNRDTTVLNERTNFEVYFTGYVMDRVEVQFGLNRTNNRTHEIGRNYLLRSAAAAAIESGDYLLTDPYNADPSILNGMSVTTSREGVYDQDEYFGSASFDMFEMANGPVSFFIGAEHRKIKYADIYDSLSEAGQVGGSSGNSAAGNRDLTAVYFETLVPLLDNLELNIAGRYDDYSDYGSDFSPKFSLRYQPFENLTLRASYGQGFRAPTLDILTQKPSDSADTISDEATCVSLGLDADCRIQIQAVVVANPELQSEQSAQYSLGLAYEPLDWFNFTLDYYNIEVDNRIRGFSSQALINALRAGDPVPPGLGCVADPITNAIEQCIRGFGNEGLINVSGVDLNARFDYSALGGQFNHVIQLSHQFVASVDGGRNTINDPGTPADRMVIANNYTYGAWTFGYNMNLIGDQFDNIAAGGIGEGHVPTWITHDLQLNYHTNWYGRVTLGVRNISEKGPPINLGNVGSRSYDFNLYDGFGRVTYLRYTQTF